MCSRAGGGAASRGTVSRAGQPATLDQLGRAIDELAATAQARDVTTRDVATRLARVWEMVADLDPELARRLAGYDL